MPTPLTDWAFAQTGPVMGSAASFVLVHLAYRADHEGLPLQTTSAEIAEATALSQSAVQRALKLGLISLTPVRDTNGYRLATSFWLHSDRVVARAAQVEGVVA